LTLAVAQFWQYAVDCSVFVVNGERELSFIAHESSFASNVI
jgi:hypothetical protein